MVSMVCDYLTVRVVVEGERPWVPLDRVSPDGWSIDGKGRLFTLGSAGESCGLWYARHGGVHCSFSGRWFDTAGVDPHAAVASWYERRLLGGCLLGASLVRVDWAIELPYDVEWTDRARPLVWMEWERCAAIRAQLRAVLERVLPEHARSGGWCEDQRISETGPTCYLGRRGRDPSAMRERDWLFRIYVDADCRRRGVIRVECERKHVYEHGDERGLPRPPYAVIFGQVATECQRAFVELLGHDVPVRMLAAPDWSAPPRVPFTGVAAWRQIRGLVEGWRVRSLSEPRSAAGPEDPDLTVDDALAVLRRAMCGDEGVRAVGRPSEPSDVSGVRAGSPPSAAVGREWD